MKRFFFLTLAAFLLFLTVSLTASAESLFLSEDSAGETGISYASASGECGANLTWDFLDGTLTIRGTGAMTDYSVKGYGSTTAP